MSRRRRLLWFQKEVWLYRSLGSSQYAVCALNVISFCIIWTKVLSHIIYESRCFQSRGHRYIKAACLYKHLWIWRWHCDREMPVLQLWFSCCNKSTVSGITAKQKHLGITASHVTLQHRIAECWGTYCSADWVTAGFRHQHKNCARCFMTRVSVAEKQHASNTSSIWLWRVPHEHHLPDRIVPALKFDGEGLLSFFWGVINTPVGVMHR